MHTAQWEVEVERGTWNAKLQKTLSSKARQIRNTDFVSSFIPLFLPDKPPSKSAPKKFATKMPKLAKKKAQISRSLCRKGHRLEKSIPPPVVAMVTNISSGQTQTKSSAPAHLSIVHPISFHFIENTICSKENYLLLRCIYFILKSFLLWVVPLMSLFLFHDISWSEQSVIILWRPTSFASCWPLCRHFCHLFHLPANLFIAVRLN